MYDYISIIVCMLSERIDVQDQSVPVPGLIDHFD